MSSQSLDDSIPAALEGANALLELCIFRIGSRGMLLAMGKKAKGNTELTVFLLELADSVLKEGELGLSAVARVLGGNTVAVRTGLLALIGGQV